MKSQDLYERACKCIPGGVNSPVRAYQSVGEIPRFIDRAHGPWIWDVDNNQYIDFVGSWGPMILGHDNEEVKEAVIKACDKGLSFGAATEAEVEMAELICSLVPGIEMIRMVNSGTEAVMSAIRTARGFTGRDKIIKFTGCYHGHSDALLVKAGSGVMTAGVPDSAGVPEGCTKDTLCVPYNDLDMVMDLFEQYGSEIAAVIVEPVGANMGVVLPCEGFLTGLRNLCTQYGALLIFDEVITGFRLGIDGAQGYFDITPDLTTFGKIIGGGMPVGAYGGRKDVMEVVAPLGSVYQAGTLSGNPIAMAAGMTELRILRDHPEIYEQINEMGEYLYGGLRQWAEENNLPVTVNYCGSLGCVFFTEEPVIDYESAKTSDMEKFAAYFKKVLRRGVYIAPSQFEALFLSYAHTRDIAERALDIMKDCLKS